MPAVRPSILLLLALTPLTWVQAADEKARQKRLQSMPRERRLVLEERLKEFDALPSEERTRIRALDEQLQALPASDRQRLYILMRAYHDWLETLPEKTRRKIRQADPADRIALINEVRSRRNKSSPETGDSNQALQVSSLVREMPRQTAVDLKFWFSLAPEERTRLLKRPNPDRQRAEFQALARKSSAFRHLHTELNRRIRKEVASLRDNMKNRQSGLATRLRPFEIPKSPPKDRIDSLRRAAELFFLAEFDPQPVSLRNLARFKAALPPWVRVDAEALPPDAAHQRLILLYRLTFPAPQELPGPSSPSKERGRTETAPPPHSPGTSTPL